MVTVDFTNLTQDYFFEELEQEAFVSSSTTFYEYTTVNGHQVVLQGTGIAVNGSNVPTAGTITSIVIDLGNNSPVAFDIEISGLSFDITDISSLGGSGTQAFWEIVLDGKTNIIGSPNFAHSISGDIGDVEAGNVVFGSNDMIQTGPFGSSIITGDANVVTDGMVIGGDDQFTGLDAFLYGDVRTLEDGGRLIGGDDVFTVIEDSTVSGQVIISGDGGTQRNNSTAFGGDDIIDLRDAVTKGSGSWFIAGDMFIQSGAGSYHEGGDDTIYLTSFNTIAYGDTRGILDEDAVFIGGDDTIFGGSGGEFIFGDSEPGFDAPEATFSGGNDILYGAGGADFVRGNAGNDSLFGGDQADELYGDAGADFVKGGNGGDDMHGGDGADTLNAGAGADTLDGGTGKDKLNGSDGKDILFGGEGKDELFGGGGNDTLEGGEGADQLFGGGGKDKLFGDAGNDKLTGGAKADQFQFFSGNDKDRILDFKNNTDTIVLDSELWDGNNLSVSDVIDDFAEIINGNAVFNFGDGDVLTINNVNNLNSLADDIAILNI